ncbi:hypothetical protein E2562_002340 [Oryza meyeriana var. granulata]|uniref:Uncharacterized protein n=1 Tax=Oryza meyeriana var. granulata TaxID=110450 RepID=A0A6G1BJN0_9ORYZ|nr:hypothetical protein E2562_002340 [Oryza meyeriana var. granulata]
MIDELIHERASWGQHGHAVLLPPPRQEKDEVVVAPVFPSAVVVVGVQQLQQGGSYGVLKANKPFCLPNQLCTARGDSYTGRGCMYGKACHH